jgi:excisionase family DNA binding protein
MPETLDFRDPEWVAEKLNLDKNAVYRYLNEGLLPGMQLGRKWLISESSLAEFLKAEQRRQTQTRRLISESHQFESWSERLRAALEAARDEALVRNDGYIGTEHLLWALVSDATNAAAAMLQKLRVDRQQILEAIDAAVAPGHARPGSGPIGLTPRAKRALELASAEAETMNHNRVGCEHLLLGLLAEGESVAASILTGLSVTLASAREQLAEATAEAHE